jgi:MFS family permease
LQCGWCNNGVTDFHRRCIEMAVLHGGNAAHCIFPHKGHRPRFPHVLDAAATGSLAGEALFPASKMALLPAPNSLRQLPLDGWLLFATRFIRLFAYGLLAVVLVLYLAEVGLTDTEIGALLTLTLLGDTAISLSITTTADRRGRRKMLFLGAMLMLLAAIVFASTGNFWLLLFAATIGVISPGGNDVGPFLSVEQASLSHIVASTRRTSIFAWYNLAGSVATALGSLCGGLLTTLSASAGSAGADVYRPAVFAYGLLGLVMGGIFFFLSPSVEVQVNQAAKPETKPFLGLHKSRGIVFKLSALFALDSFGGGFVMQSLLAYWLHVRFGADPAALGGIFLAANLLAGVSALAAGWLANRFGLINTMVFTHLPSNVLLVLVPLMPSLEWAVALLLLRYSISQMDVPTRQAYTISVVDPDERSAASGVTAVARSVGAAMSPVLSAHLLGVPSLASLPFFLAGGIKIVYDLLLLRAFGKVRPEEGER